MLASSECRPLARWTIGPVSRGGFQCLEHSIRTFTRLYDVDVIVCHNCDPQQLPASVQRHKLYDQRPYLSSTRKPVGVAWKLYPARLAPERHEIVIDNDIVFEQHIPEIDRFFQGHETLLLEGASRTYGRFEKHVPANYRINSGIYGMPPGFNLQKWIDFLAGPAWEKNAFGEHDKSETFDEQGIVACALLNHRGFHIIPDTSITNCEHHLIEGKGYHFISLNRQKIHHPFRLYQCRNWKVFL